MKPHSSANSITRNSCRSELRPRPSSLKKQEEMRTRPSQDSVSSAQNHLKGPLHTERKVENKIDEEKTRLLRKEDMTPNYSFFQSKNIDSPGHHINNESRASVLPQQWGPASKCPFLQCCNITSFTEKIKFRVREILPSVLKNTRRNLFLKIQGSLNGSVAKTHSFLKVINVNATKEGSLSALLIHQNIANILIFPCHFLHCFEHFLSVFLLF